jgi:hypothetical protein
VMAAQVVNSAAKYMPGKLAQSGRVAKARPPRGHRRGDWRKP